ncbi:carbohydrate ABC transporter permease [Cellulomonas sp. P4]|uniref:carbohydrate ABC transporter permease n=1 Tax=Cellulomonas sp. P4 TaxID=3142533 RepID=UPI0031B9E006
MSSTTLPTRAAAAADPGRATRPRPLSRHGRWVPYTFVAPAMLVLLTFAVLPIGVAAVVSATDMDIAGLADPGAVRFVGLENYTRLLGDPDFWRAMSTTGLLTVVGVPVIVVLSLGVALLLHRSGGRLARVLRSFYFLPAITAIVAVALVWGYLFNSQFGLFNHLLGLVGLGPVPWLSDPAWARFSVGLVAVWRASGLNIIIFLAALQAIPAEYDEAAQLDGAGEARRTWSITVPLLRFAIFFVTITTVIAWLQFFDEPYVLTQGGPNGATRSISLYLYEQGFRHNQFGFASAGSLVLFAVIGAVTWFQLRLRRGDDEH